MGHWSKHTNYEKSANSPLIIRIPWLGHSGITCDALVETVDLFPTVLELCGITEQEVCDGKSLVPLLKDPDRYSRQHYETVNVVNDLAYAQVVTGMVELLEKGPPGQFPIN